MEFFKCQVHEKSPHVTGKIPYVKTLEGYQVPLSIINGLPYMKLRPYTDAEWEKLPKIYLTSDDPWDPSVLDSKVPEEWYKSQPRDMTYLRDNPFDIHGEYRTGNPDEENEVPDPPGELEADMAHRTPSRPVSRRSIKAYLHNLVKDELDHEFEVYYADGDMYEHIDYDKRIRQIREVQQPRRSKRLMGKDKAQTAKQGSGTQKRRSKKSRKRGNYPVTKPGAVDVDDEYQSVEDIEDPRNVKDEVPSDDEIEPVVRLDSNNPAWMENPNEDKSLRPVRNGPKFVEPSKINYEEYARFFPGASLESIKRTFQAMTQFGRIGAAPGLTTKSRIKAPNPALNVPRRHEDVATDTIYGPKKVPAIDDGSTAAQFFIGRKSMYRTIVGCGRSDGAFAKVLMDEIRRNGAMDTLISDRAKAEIGVMVQDILRVLFIKDKQSEPHKKNQEFAERGWQDTKRVFNNLMNWSGAPKFCWLKALRYVCFVQNHLALASLNWRTPTEWLKGMTPDISVLLQFVFYELVYVPLVDGKLGSTEIAGRFVGISTDVGHKMTYEILIKVSKTRYMTIYRSDCRSASKGGAYKNVKALSEAGKLGPQPPVYTRLPDDTPIVPFAPSDGIEHEIEPDSKEKLDGDASLSEGGKTVILGETPPSTDSNTADVSAEAPDPVRGADEESQQPRQTLTEPARARADGIGHPASAGTDIHQFETYMGETVETFSDRVMKNLSEAENKEIDEMVTRRSIDGMPVIDISGLVGRTFIADPDENQEQVRAKIERINPTNEATADGSEELYKFRCKVGDRRFEEIMTYNQMLEWCNRDIDKDDMFRFDAILDHRWCKDRSIAPSGWLVLVQWSSGERTWNDKKLTTAGDPVMLAIYAKKNGLTKVWPETRRILKNKKTLARMIHQTKLRVFRNQPRYKFGEQVPRNHEEAMWIDQKNGNDRWARSEAIELGQLDEYDSFEDLGEGAELPEGYKLIRCHMVYDVKFDGRYKSRFVAGGRMTDEPVENTYSGVVSIPGLRIITTLAELNDLELWQTDIGNAYLESVTKEKVAFIAGPEFGDRAGHTLIIYKAQYGLKSSGKRWHDKLHDVLRGMGFLPSKAEEDIWMREAGDHYEYIAVYVDDLMIASREPQKIVDGLTAKPHEFKLKGTGKVTYHLGNDFFRDEDGTLCVGPRKYIERMAAEYERMYGEKPSRKVSSPLEKNDHPELDESPLLDDQGIRQYQSLIGTLQWTITMGRFDIATAVMTMSGFRVAPRVGHLERVKRICGYIWKMKLGCIRVRTKEPDFSDLPDPHYDWTRTVYGEVHESIPEDAPKPLGKRVVLSSYKDANLYHDLVTGRSVTGVLHFMNQTPVDWFCKKQATVETATYGSEFGAARTAVQQIAGLRTMLRYLGVPVYGGTRLFGDNESVITSSTKPHSQLSKRHHGLAYHYTREAIASGMVSMHHVPSECNPADILSKHWGYSQVWPLLQAVLFWHGDTADLLVDTSGPQQAKGSDKISPETGKLPSSEGGTARRAESPGDDGRRA